MATNITLEELMKKFSKEFENKIRELSEKDNIDYKINISKYEKILIDTIHEYRKNSNK